MSSTWIAEFDNEKDYNHFCNRYKEIAPNGGNIIVPDFPGNPKMVRERGARVDLKETIYIHNDDYENGFEKNPAYAISFDIAIWDNWTKDFICCIMQEMCKRYSFVEIGCDSEELVSQEEFLKYGVFHHEKKMIEYLREIYKKDPDFIKKDDIDISDFDEEAEEKVIQTEKSFREAAKRFFDGDASDLILKI